MRDSILFEEQILRNQHSDFSARYIAACNLRSIVHRSPGAIRQETLAYLEQLMDDRRILRHRQSFFLFREAALTMTAVVKGTGSPLARQALISLKRLVRCTTGPSLHATTEALGSLPFAISPLNMQDNHCKTLPLISWQDITEKAELAGPQALSWKGRSISCPLPDEKSMLVVKLARRGEEIHNLLTEVAWMRYLQEQNTALPVRFDIPSPLSFENSMVFRLHNLPDSAPVQSRLHPEGIAIAFVAPRDYYSYVNETLFCPTFAHFKQSLSDNAWILGHLTGLGIVHTAPIPLFHNRVQRHRRQDNGLYDWTRSGRLDQWLASCRHPNMGLSGTRDFEHFLFIDSAGEKIYWHIGSHILSLLLICGSYFRNREKRAGLDAQGLPVDVRAHFDATVFSELIHAVLSSYYKGFTGENHTCEMPFDLKYLTGRMVDEMGKDRYMDEMLRQIDQQQMDDATFKEFLISRGFTRQKAAATVKGVADIVLTTGPHLGAFNQRISIPEIIEATAAMAATCVLGRFVRENTIEN